MYGLWSCLAATVHVPGWSKRTTPLPFMVQVPLEPLVSENVTGLPERPPVAVGV